MPSLAAHVCYGLKPGAAVLDVSASDGDEWQLPWQQFTSARHGKEGEQECSWLTFVSHAVSVRGHRFAALREAIRESCLAMLRVAPTKYERAASEELFISALHVQPVGESNAKSES
ncbi:hypothetical protein DB347_25015 [Opitutaceae bacterium EW11]|nr:hypothetical protein DB347_25015 [Opitutaceae bacterium EW11]